MILPGTIGLSVNAGRTGVYGFAEKLPRMVHLFSTTFRSRPLAVAGTARRTFAIPRTIGTSPFPFARTTGGTGFTTRTPGTFSHLGTAGRALWPLPTHFVQFGPQTLDFVPQFAKGVHHVLQMFHRGTTLHAPFSHARSRPHARSPLDRHRDWRTSRTFRMPRMSLLQFAHQAFNLFARHGLTSFG